MSNKMALDALTKILKIFERDAFDIWLEAKSPSGDVEQVQRQWESSSEYSEFCDKWADARAAIAALQAEPQPEQEEGFTQGVNAAVSMLEKIAVDHCEKHAWTDPDTGVRELKPGPIEDYYNTVMELADDIRSIVYAPGERENTAQALKAAKDAAFEQAANLLECEYAEDAKQKRRLDQIAQHIRDLKKRSS